MKSEVLRIIYLRSDEVRGGTEQSDRARREVNGQAVIAYDVRGAIVASLSGTVSHPPQELLTNQRLYLVD
jgi:hypothetical protein